jgi:hypothetical protein
VAGRRSALLAARERTGCGPWGGHRVPRRVVRCAREGPERGEWTWWNAGGRKRRAGLKATRRSADLLSVGPARCRVASWLYERVNAMEASEFRALLEKMESRKTRWSTDKEDLVGFDGAVAVAEFDDLVIVFGAVKPNETPELRGWHRRYDLFREDGLVASFVLRWRVTKRPLVKSLDIQGDLVERCAPPSAYEE